LSTRPKNFRIDDSAFAFVVRRPVAILMVTLAVAVFGSVSYQRLALTLMPDMSYPTLTVRTSYPGTAPEEMETVVSRPLEQQLGIIPKLVAISSISKAGQSDVVLEFQWKTDMDLIAQEVREKVDRIRLPDGAQRPLLLHYDPSLDPILRLGLAGPQSLYELRYLAENDVKRKIETIPGVAAVQVKGGLEEQFLVAIDESKLSALKLDISQVATRLQQANVNMPGGNLREGQTEYLIRTLNEFRTLEEIGSVIIGRQNNVDVRLRDIAAVSRFHEDLQVITRVNDRESVELEIFKEADANVLVVADAVKTAIFGRPDQQAYVAALDAPAGQADTTARPRSTPAAQLAARSTAQALMMQRQMTDFLAYNLPTDASLQLLSDQSVFIDSSIREVKSNALLGGIIAIVVLYLFLRNFVQTLIVSLCIPISILATFAPMHMAGVSLNIISLGGLALGVGNLVDNAIVVLESIFRCREEGDDSVTAVVRGTSEVAMPVVASTLTTVAVFFPIVFVEGVAGQLFGDMALAVVFSQIASLIAALYLIPMLAALLSRFGAGEGSAGSAAVSPLGTSAYLSFPARPAGASRSAHAGRLLREIVLRSARGALVMAAVATKAVLALGATAIWPVLWPVTRLRQKTATTAAWLAADTLGPIRSDWVWPGMLSFSGLQRLGPSLADSARWLAAHRWRWIALLALPAAGVATVLGLRLHLPAIPAAPPGPVLPGITPALDTPWLQSIWTWTRDQPWWLLVLLFVPGAIPFILALARTLAEVALRLAGTLLQTAALLFIQAVIGIVSALSAVCGPVIGLALSGFHRGHNALQRRYPAVLSAALHHRGLVLGAACAAVAICITFVLPRLGRDLIPQVHQGEFNLDLTLPVGTPIERTGAMAARIDRAVLGQPEVERTALTVGAEEGASAAIDAGEHTARLTVKLKTGLNAEAEATLIDRIRSEFADLPELKLEVSYPALFSFKSPIEVEIRGHDLTTLRRLSLEAEGLLGSSVPGLVDLRSTLQSGHPEIQVVYQRDQLAEYGLNLRTVADLVRNKVQGRVATEFRQSDQLIDILVRLREEDRFGIEELRRLNVNPGGAIPISLSSIAELTVNEGPSEIRRVDQQRTALITANIKDADLATVSADIVTTMEQIAYPAGFSYTLAGQNQEMRTSLNSLLLAFALAVFLVYITMASQFESLVQPLLIMMTVPLALIGVVVVLWLAAIPVTIMVFLGVIILVGIVVNNAIVLVDYTNTLRRRGLGKVEAILEAGRARLRPILMTATTTIVGLVPMALGLGDGAEIRAPMAITVIVGLSTATLLTLVVIPTLYDQFTSNRPLANAPSAAQPPAGSETDPIAK
jgi:multidrug efflux pump subunit AcrB